MVPFNFSHLSVAYEIRFSHEEGRWSATLFREGEEHGRRLVSTYDEAVVVMSDAAIRTGFIAVAQWLVATVGASSRQDEWDIAQAA